MWNDRSTNTVTDACTLINARLVIQVSFIFAILFANQIYAQVKFEDKTVDAGYFHKGESWGASWGDMDGDLYPDLFVSNHGMLTSLYKNNGGRVFTDVITTAGTTILANNRMADIHGGSWADIDNDGDQDLLVTRASTGARVYVYKNNGKGSFTEATGYTDIGFGIGGYGGGRAAMIFDYDNDGWLDAAIASNSGAGLGVFRRNITDSTNNYMNTTATVGMNNKCKRNHYGIISRLFNNRNLIYLCVSESKVPEFAFDMSSVPFRDVTSKFDTVGTSSDTALADFNNDLNNDLFVLNTRVRPSGAKRISANRIEAWLSVGKTTEKSFSFKSTGPIKINLYARNVGDCIVPNVKNYCKHIRLGSSGYHPLNKPFTLSRTKAENFGVVAKGVRDNQFAYDGVGYSVYVGYDTTNQKWTVYLNGGNGGSEHVYFTVTGDGLTQPFVNGIKGVDLSKVPTFLMNNGHRMVNKGSRDIGAIMCGGAVAADFDNDMDVDLYLVCRSSLENFANRIYWNNGNGKFTLDENHGAQGAIGAGIESPAGTGEMAVSADMDLNGTMDLFVTNGNRLFPHIVNDGFTAGGWDRLFKNLGNENHAIEIDLQGVKSNRDGYGARVIVTAGGVSQLREQTGQFHRWSHDHKRLHFGLGTNTSATVTIEWPDGTKDVHKNVEAGRLYRAVQNGSLKNLYTFGLTLTPILLLLL